MAALFRAEPETAPKAETPSVARSVHEARRMRQAGDLDGALAVFAGVDTARAETREARWAYAEWTDLVRRRFGDRDAPPRWCPPATGRLRSRRCVMVVANASVDIPALKARHPLGDTVEASGVRLRGRGRVRQGVCPFHDEAEASFTVYADSQRWYRFGCGLGGDVLDFIQRVENLSLPDAIRRLGGGPGLAAGAAPRPVPARRPRATPLPPRDPALLTAAVRFYAGQLRRSPAAFWFT